MDPTACGVCPTVLSPADHGPDARDAGADTSLIAPDTSVPVAAFALWHEHHGVARRALNGAQLIAHSILETYSVLTRLPPPHRVPARVAADFLSQITTSPPLVLDATVMGAFAAKAGRVGGSGARP